MVFEFYFTEFALAQAVAKLKKARAFLIIWFIRCNDQHLYLEVYYSIQEQRWQPIGFLSIRVSSTSRTNLLARVIPT
jgi:hypothetical protein